MLELIGFLGFALILAFLEIKGFSHPVLWLVCGLWAVGTHFKRESKPTTE